MTRFAKLFEPLKVGQITLKNRIAMSSMGTNTAGEEGLIDDLSIKYYAARARGGTGLINIESTVIDYPIGLAIAHLPSVHDDKCIPGLTRLTEEIHRYGAKCCLQLQHAGPRGRSYYHGMQPIAPSVVQPSGYEMPRELTIDEIKQIVVKYADAAERAQKAGFDAVEVHAANYYLLNSFLSAAWNKRTDEYGGSLENRARFWLEVIRAIRERVGTDFTVWTRLMSRELQPGEMTSRPEYGVEGAQTFEETKKLAKWGVEASLDAINLTGAPMIPYPWDGVAINVPYAAELKKVVTVPIFVAGMINTPQLGENILREGKADVIVFGRPQIADPELANKIRDGRLEDITTCIRCVECHDGEPLRLRPIRCATNAAAGKEDKPEYWDIKPAEKRKKVVVVGAGPGGMEAARVAALRGHEVLLYDRAPRLGGNLVLAGMIRDELQQFRQYLEIQLKKLNVKLVLGKEVTVADIESIRPDVVILATGSTSPTLDIPGVDRPNVISSSDIMGDHQRPVRGFSWRRFFIKLGSAAMKTGAGFSLAKWVLRNMPPFGKKVVVMGGGLAGLELAEFLVRRGKEVTIVETLEGITQRAGPMPSIGFQFLNLLSQKKVPMLTGVKWEEITPKGVVITTKEGKRQTVEADTVLLALGFEPNAKLYQTVKEKFPEIHLVGDCIENRYIPGSVDDGARIGRLL